MLLDSQDTILIGVVLKKMIVPEDILIVPMKYSLMPRGMI